MKARAIRNILIVEDNLGDARLLIEMLSEHTLHDITLKHVECMVDAEIHLAAHSVDMILLDLGLPDAQGLQAVRRAHAIAPRVPLVVLSGFDDESMAVQALNEGAQDYLIKGQIEPRELVRALRYSVERKKIEDSLFDEMERAQATLACIGDAVICTDVLGQITYLNVVAEILTGWSLEEAKGRLIHDAFHIVDAITRLPILDPVKRILQQNETAGIPLDAILIRKDRTEITIEDSVSPIHDREANVIGAVIIVRDVTVGRAMARQMNHTIQHDHLTDLPNRSLLNDRIGQAIALARRNNHRSAIIFLDLDGFKHINDSLGHPSGDKLIQSVASRLVSLVRNPDTVSRQGGDEFIILLSEIRDVGDAAITARRILRALEDPHSIDSHELYITASIGVSIYPDDGLDSETLIRNADTAMYQAKENDRQGYQFFRTDMNVRAMERLFLEENLRQALSRNELAVHYQPKLNLKTGTIIGVEALLRWTHPERGEISPAEFIPVAEDSGLILPIGLWILRAACMQAQEWASTGFDAIAVAVNVSAVQLRHRDFVSSLFAILDETHLEPRLLEVELTESILMKRPELTCAILLQLREKGISIAIDDFGTGYSSLSYLHKFPLDALKIDQSFVRQITKNGGTGIVNAIIDMGQNLGLRIVAEGVETRDELSFLQLHHCDEAQGYYFSRPLPGTAVTELLKFSKLGTPEDFASTQTSLTLRLKTAPIFRDFA
jgi:diguanylate cyclase (GGDEF)-like protein/PAS domain S-box-containing protein